MFSFFRLWRLEGFRVAVCCSSFERWPKLLYFCVGSPLVAWALGGVAWRKWFMWPKKVDEDFDPFTPRE